jgi:DNA polymerase III delta subunit
MIILHGENIVQSRNRLAEFITQTKQAGRELTRLEAKQLDLAILGQTFGTQSLFGEEKVIVIEELHSLPKSKKKDELIAAVASYGKDATQVIIWEKRTLTPTMLKKFAGAKSEEFKLTNSLFKWLDGLTGQPSSSTQKTQLQTLRQAITHDGEVMCLFMLARQLRLLLQAQEGNFTGLPPFMIGKLSKQAQTFTLEQLLKMHHRLLQIDESQKTSASRLGLGQRLELLLVGL